AGKQLSEALGRIPASTDLKERHPFDVEVCRIFPGKAAFPYHSHSAQWEFYYVISGTGLCRDEEGEHAIGTGDAFIYPPDEAHQLINNSSADLVLFIVADNPIGESCYYPDSAKWLVRSPSRNIIRSDPLDYFDGEESVS
ncbi:MAG: cupin, partial [Chthoniobacterales bacterium]